MKITANNISMNYEITGQGQWLTLIHGAGDNLEAWWNQVLVFSKHYRVLTYDVRGYGQTETPHEEYNTDILVQDLSELLNALDIKESHILGYSMGGRIALGLALAHPDKVKTLILANSGVVPMTRSQEEMEEMNRLRQQRMETVEKQGSLESVVTDESISMVFSPGWPEKNKGIIERYKKIQLKNTPQAYLTVARAMVWGTPPPDASPLRMPTLIIAAEHDTWSGAEAARAGQKLIAGSKLVIMPTGHASAIEQPDQFNHAVLDFLKGT